MVKLAATAFDITPRKVCNQLASAEFVISKVMPILSYSRSMTVAAGYVDNV